MEEGRFLATPSLRFSRLRTEPGWGCLQPIERMHRPSLAVRRAQVLEQAERRGLPGRCLASPPAALSLLGNLPPPPPPGARGVCGAQTWGREPSGP